VAEKEQRPMRYPPEDFEDWLALCALAIGVGLVGALLVSAVLEGLGLI
jgi:hypothetical protein